MKNGRSGTCLFFMFSIGLGESSLQLDKCWMHVLYRIVCYNISYYVMHSILHCVVQYVIFGLGESSLQVLDPVARCLHRRRRHSPRDFEESDA